MKTFFILFFMTTLGFSKVYYSKVEPYEIRNISSNVSGLVLYTQDNKIGKKLLAKPYLLIDSELDEEELKNINTKLAYLKDMIVTNQNVLQNLEKSLKKKNENYNKIKSLKIKSTVEKDREFYDLVGSENQLLSTQKDIQNLNIQISDLKLRSKQLKRSISDKKLVANGFVLYSISVKVGQVVGIATPLAQVADISKAKLTIYLDEEDALNAQSKVVYIDGIKSKYKISRLLNIADSKNISKYMAQIITKPPQLFSKLVKVELKNE